MIKKIMIVIIIILSSLLVILLSVDYKQNLERNKINEQKEAEMLPLCVTQNDLLDQIDELDRDYKKKLNGKSIVTLLYTHVGEEIYNDVFPYMNNYDYSGMITLSSDSFVGMDNCITKKQIKELINDGWSWCIKWPQESDNPIETCKELIDKAEQLNIGSTSFIYFEDSDDVEEYQSWIDKNDYEIITDTISWRNENRRYKLDNAIDNGEDLIYNIPFLCENYSFDLSNELDYLESMLDVLQEYESNDSILVDTVLFSKEYRKNLEEENRDLYEEWSKSRNLLEKELKEIEKKIEQVEKKYFIS